MEPYLGREAWSQDRASDQAACIAYLLGFNILTYRRELHGRWREQYQHDTSKPADSQAKSRKLDSVTHNLPDHVVRGQKCWRQSRVLPGVRG